MRLTHVTALAVVLHALLWLSTGAEQGINERPPRHMVVAGRAAPPEGTTTLDIRVLLSNQEHVVSLASNADAAAVIMTFCASHAMTPSACLQLSHALMDTYAAAQRWYSGDHR